MSVPANLNSGIRDNHLRGAVGEYLRDAIRDDCHMSVVSAFFTVYAYEALKESLNSIGHMDFLFGEPRFVRALDATAGQDRAIAGELVQLPARVVPVRRGRERRRPGLVACVAV